MKPTLPQVIGAFAVAGLFALAPVAAQDGDARPADPPREADDRGDGNQTTNQTRPPDDGPDDAPDPPDGTDDGADDGADDGTDGDGPGARPDWARGWPEGLKHVSFEIGDDGIEDYRVGGVQMLESLRLRGLDSVHVKQNGSLYTIAFDGGVLRIQDAPVGLLSFRPHGTIAALEFPDDARIQRGAEGAKIGLDGHRAILIAGDGRWTDDGFISTGFFSYHLRAAPPQERPDRPHDDEVEQAIADRRVAAEIDLDDIDEDDDGVEAYDELDIDVERPVGPATPERPVQVRVGGEVEGGRTVVARLPTAALGGPQVSVLGFLANDDGSRTELRIHQADSLQDVLDPTDDGGRYEYWVVQDADGVQVILSMGHVAETEFEVSGFGEVLVQPSVIAGIAIGAVGAVAAGAGMFWPRRR